MKLLDKNFEEIPVRLNGEIELFKKTKILKTGDALIDEFLSLESTLPIMIAGSPYTGKTTLAISIASSTIAEGKKVFYIDTEYGFSGTRLKQICKARSLDENNITRNMKVLRIDNLDLLFRYVKYACRRYDLIIIDSISRPIIKEMNKQIMKEGKTDEKILIKAYNLLHEAIVELSEREKSIMFTNEIIPKIEKEDVFYTLKLSFNKLAVLAKIIIGMIMRKGRRFMYIERHSFKPSVYEYPVFIEYKIDDSGIRYLNKVYIERDKISYYVEVY